ncbi:MAG TPA: hypothetical protein PLB60_04555, partial [Candidatus Marinimicrobia bacterium]|nr:hypothetical protein [Candidatus Neomarinimicrobiota bacterium]
VFLAIDQIKAATQHLQPLTEITGIAPTDLVKIKTLNGQMLDWINLLQNGIRIESQGDKQTTKWGAGLPEPLQVSVFWQENSKRYPISGLPVEFKLLAGKAAFNPYSQTDASGCAFCSVREIRTAGKVEFEALVKFPEGYQITPTSARLTLLPDNKVIMIVNETNLGNPVNMPILGNLLLQTLTESGFHILEANPFSQLTNSQIEQMSPTEIQQAATNSGADLILLASVSSDQPNRVQDGFYFAHARGVLKVYNISQQAFVGNYLVEDKNAGNSPENAGAKAIKKVSDALIQKFSDEFGL